MCQACVHIVDSDQWVQVEPSVCTDEGGSEFRISPLAGWFVCSRTRMRWVCAGNITLQYHAVDACFLRAELERLQCEWIGPVIDVTVISGKLEEAHLPHYASLAEIRTLSHRCCEAPRQKWWRNIFTVCRVDPLSCKNSPTILLSYNSNYKLVYKVGRTL